VEEFIEFRRQIKKEMTDHAIELMLKKLNEYSSGDIETAKKILERSILSGWTGIFPLKEQSFGNVFSDRSRTEKANGPGSAASARQTRRPAKEMRRAEWDERQRQRQRQAELLPESRIEKTQMPDDIREKIAKLFQG
jgi:hypothetical protein